MHHEHKYLRDLALEVKYRGLGAGGMPFEFNTTGLVSDGDITPIDIPNRSLSLHLSDEELQRCREKWKCLPPRVAGGYLRRYGAQVGSVWEGAPLTDRDE